MNFREFKNRGERATFASYSNGRDGRNAIPDIREIPFPCRNVQRAQPKKRRTREVVLVFFPPPSLSPISPARFEKRSGGFLFSIPPSSSSSSFNATPYPETRYMTDRPAGERRARDSRHVPRPSSSSASTTRDSPDEGTRVHTSRNSIDSLATRPRVPAGTSPENEKRVAGGLGAKHVRRPRE